MYFFAIIFTFLQQNILHYIRLNIILSDSQSPITHVTPIFCLTHL